MSELPGTPFFFIVLELLEDLLTVYQVLKIIALEELPI